MRLDELEPDRWLVREIEFDPSQVGRSGAPFEARSVHGTRAKFDDLEQAVGHAVTSLGASPKRDGFYIYDVHNRRTHEIRRLIPKEGEPDGYVYLINGGTLVKIGTARNPDKRCRGLQTGSPVELRLLARAPGNELHEKALHHRHRDVRRHGEWFDLPTVDDWQAWLDDQIASLELFDPDDGP